MDKWIKPDEVQSILDFKTGIDRYYVSLQFEKDGELITNNNLAMNSIGDYFHDEAHFSQADIEDGNYNEEATPIEWGDLPKLCQATVWNEVLEVNEE